MKRKKAELQCYACQLMPCRELKKRFVKSVETGLGIFPTTPWALGRLFVQLANGCLSSPVTLFPRHCSSFLRYSPDGRSAPGLSTPMGHTNFPTAPLKTSLQQAGVVELAPTPAPTLSSEAATRESTAGSWLFINHCSSLRFSMPTDSARAFPVLG